MDLAEPKPIREYENADRRLLDEVIRPAGQPAVFRGLAADWPAVEAARSSDQAFVDYVKRFSTGAKVRAIVGQPEIRGRFFYSEDMRGLNFERGLSPLEPFLDRLL